MHKHKNKFYLLNPFFFFVTDKETVSFDHLFDQLYELHLPDIKLIKVKDPHISLTKTFVLLYHWIKEFHLSIKEKVKVLHRFVLFLVI